MKPTPLLLLPLLILGLAAQDRERAPRPGREGGMPGGRVRPSEATPSAPGGGPSRGFGPARPGPIHRTTDSATLPTPVPRRPGPLETYPGTRTVVPPAWDRCTTLPDDRMWVTRNLFNEIQWIARKGLVPVTEVPPGTEELTDYAIFPAGWRGYGVAIPAGGKLTVELSHGNLGWFRLLAVRRDGTPGPGMLNAMTAHRPVAFTLSNPTGKAGVVYIVVDDPGWMSGKDRPYKLTFKRDWDVAKVDLSGVKVVEGIWGASPSVSAEFRGPSLTGPAVFPH